MSIALDLALFMRNSKTKLKLSLTARCVANVLAFRVGSNADSWISQKTLSKELGVSESNVRTHCLKLKQSGLILIKQSRKDKRKNLYSFVKILFNYHSMNDAQKKEVHVKFNDIENITARNQAVFAQSTARNQAVSTARNQAVLSLAQTSEDLEAVGVEDLAQSPKGTIEKNTISKTTLSCAKEPAQIRFYEFWGIYPRKKDKQRTEAIWIKKKLDKKAEEIIKDVKNRLEKDQQWKNPQYIPHPSTYLKFERWNDEVTLVSVNNEKLIYKKEEQRPGYRDFTQERLDREAAKSN